MTAQAIVQADKVYVTAIAVGVDKAAATLGLSKTATFWLIKKNHIPSFKVGKRRLVRVVDLEELAERLLRGEVVIQLTEDPKGAGNG